MNKRETPIKYSNMNNDPVVTSVCQDQNFSRMRSHCAPVLFALFLSLGLIACDSSNGGGVDENLGEDSNGGSDIVSGGSCDTPMPEVANTSWRHSVASGFTTALGSPNSRVRDLILAPAEAAQLRARFTYGFVDKDLEDEDVELLFRRCPDWESWGIHRTNADGIVLVDVPTDLPAGDYLVRFVVLGDGTTADGIIAVWHQDIPVVVSDIDGTLTTSDWEAVEDVVLGPDAEMYTDADTAIKRWAQKGYRIVYLTGRPQYINRYTRNWLDSHGFPFGPLQLTEQATDVIPTDAFVRVFKGDFVTDLKSRVGVNVRAAYGNATTDIGAYADAGVPKVDTWIVGPYAGEQMTSPITTYTDHLPAIETYPDAP